MVNLKQLWYRLIAGSLVQRNAILVSEVENLKLRNAELANETRIRASSEAQAVAAVVKQRMGMDPTLPGKIKMLREHLQSELAYSAYLEEHLREGTTPFNDLPLETRKTYFQRIKDKVA